MTAIRFDDLAALDGAVSEDFGPWGPEVEITGYGSAANYGGERLRFLAPVPVGSRIHARARLVAAQPRATGVVLTTEIDVRVVGADKPSMLYRMQSLYMPPRD